MTDPSSPREPEPTGSIVERFRGTQWDTHASDPTPRPPRRSGGKSTPVIMWALILVMLTGAGGLVFFVAGKLGAPAFSLPPPRPIPTKAPGADVVAAMWTLIEDSSLSYHMEDTGSAVATANAPINQKFSLSLDVAGDDYVGELAFVGAGRYVWDRYKGTVYVRLVGKTAWEKTATSDRAFRQAPFLGLEDRRQLVYAGPIVENGVTLHRLVSTAAYRPSVARMFALARFEFPFLAVDNQLELIVTDEGVPVRAVFTCTVDADPQYAMPGFTGSSTFAFSKFGQGPTLTEPPTHLP